MQLKVFLPPPNFENWATLEKLIATLRKKIIATPCRFALAAVMLAAVTPAAVTLAAVMLAAVTLAAVTLAVQAVHGVADSATL